MNLKLNNQMTKLSISLVALFSLTAMSDADGPSSTYGNAVRDVNAANDAKVVNSVTSASLNILLEKVKGDKAAARSRIYSALKLDPKGGSQHLGRLLKARLETAQSDAQFDEVIVSLDAAITDAVLAGEKIDQELQETYIKAISTGYEASLAVVALEAKASSLVAQALQAQVQSSDGSAYDNSDAKASVEALLSSIDVAVTVLNQDIASAQKAGIPSPNGDVTNASASRVKALAGSANEIAARVKQQRGEIVAQQVKIADLNTTVAKQGEEIAGLNTTVAARVSELETANKELHGLRATVESARNSVQAKNGEIDALKSQLEQTKAELAAVTSDARALAERGKNWVRKNPPLVEKYLATPASRTGTVAQPVQFETPKVGPK